MGMRCIECNANCHECRGVIKRDMPYVGEIRVPNAKWYECPKCGARYLSAETTDKLGETYKKRKEELLLSFPLGDFVSVTEAYEFLGMSRQAFGKNPLIQKKDYVHRIERFGKMLYLRQSLEAFKKKGDGRISLVDALEKARKKAARAAQQKANAAAQRKKGAGKGKKQDPKKALPPSRRPRVKK